jgi:hypothetical protein
MDNYSEIILLCEDRQQEVFARCFLVTCGVHPRRIRVRCSPAGVGSAEQFVRQQYPIEVKFYRQNRHRLSIGLVTLVDADMQSVRDQFAELEEALVNALQACRSAGERIGVFIPKRNIETWIYHLMGQTVNEDEVYSHLGKESDCKPYVQALAQKRGEPLPSDAPPSLQTACHELERIL